MTGVIRARASGRRYVVQLDDGREVIAFSRGDLAPEMRVDAREVAGTWRIVAASRG